GTERKIASPAVRAPPHLLGASGTGSLGGSSAKTGERRLDSETQNAPVPRVAAGTPTGAAAAPSTHPFPQECPRLLDWIGIGRGKKPPGAPDDWRHRPSNVAASPRA